jgi:hypothetical protein
MLHHFGQSGGLGFCDFASQRGEPVISAAFVVIRRIGPILGAQLENQAVFKHPFDGSIKSSRAEPHAAAGSFSDVLHDAVAVLVAIRQRDQDVKNLRCKRKKLHDRHYNAPRYSVKRYRSGPLRSRTILGRLANMEIPRQSDERCYSDDGVDLTMIRWMLSLTPAERLEVLQAAVNGILDIREQNAKA